MEANSSEAVDYHEYSQIFIKSTKEAQSFRELALSVTSSPAIFQHLSLKLDSSVPIHLFQSINRRVPSIETRTLPETNSLPLKMDGWETTCPFGSLPIFRGKLAVTPLKINMEHNHGGLEDHFPF